MRNMEQTYRHQALELANDLSQIKVDGSFQNSLLIHFIAMNDEAFAIKIAKRTDRASFIDIADNQCTNTALLLSLKRGYFKLAKLLIEYGADVSSIDDSGNNALHYACYLRNEELMDVLCASDSFKFNKEKCLNQKTRHEHLTPVDLYLFESQVLHTNLLVTHSNAWDYRAGETSYTRPKISLKWIQFFGCEYPSEALLNIAKQNHEGYFFRNRDYIKVECGKLVRPTAAQLEQQINNNQKYTTAAYYIECYQALRVVASKQLMDLTKRYLKHLETASNKTHPSDPQLLIEKRNETRTLLEILNDISQTEQAKISNFQSHLQQIHTVLSQHRDTGWLTFFARALSVITGVRSLFFSGPIRFWQSHGDEFVKNSASIINLSMIAIP